MMTEETLDKALEWAVDWAGRGLRCCWYGGEPLLNKKVMRSSMTKWNERFKQAGKELHWSVTTNGTLLNEDSRKLLDEFDTGILLSMDGPPELHNKSRVYNGGGPSWQDIDVDSILAWRPKLEIAWQLDPRWDFTPDHLEWMIARGFHHINFNINWLEDWSGDKRIQLEEFMRFVGRRCLQTRRGDISEDKFLFCNWMSKFDEMMMKTAAGTGKARQPCGTGLHMLALTPEGWLYPSQEMAFTAMEPDRAPGTAEYYRVGDVSNDPVMDQERLAVVSKIENKEMILPKGFDCNNCIANPVSFGGCHCRYIGQDGTDPANRFNVMVGWCQSQQSALTGILQGATIEKYVGLRLGKKPAKPDQTSPLQATEKPVQLKPVDRQEFRAQTRYNKK